MLNGHQGRIVGSRRPYRLIGLLSIGLLAGLAVFAAIDDGGGLVSAAGSGVSDPLGPPLDEPAGAPTCVADSWLSQPPHLPDGSHYFVTSDAGSDYRAYELYEEGGEVCGIRFWGLDFLYPGGYWAECTEAPMTFEIAFFEDGGGLPGAEVCSYVIDISATPTGLRYLTNLLEMNEYDAVLSPCCGLAAGWVSVRGISVGGDPEDCWFAWASAEGADGSAVQSSGETFYGVTFDRAVCLTSGTGACCLAEAPFCLLETEVGCIAVGGTFLGPGTECDLNDCNENGLPDSCDIAAGTSKDADGNGVPDECETLNFDGAITGDIYVQGTVVGTYVDTAMPDGVCQAITERESGGAPDSRYSYLEHKWLLEVEGGAVVSFNLAGYHSPSTDGDDFILAYSLDDVDYTDMLTLVRTSDDGSYQSYRLPADTVGTLYVRVLDTDQTPGNRDLDSVFIDHMFVRSATWIGDLNGDGYLDELDFALLAGCLAGPDVAYAPACLLADMDQESDVDLADLALFQDKFTGRDETPPDDPTGLTAQAGGTSVQLDWDDSDALDLAGYRLYRATVSGGPYEPVNTELVASSVYADTSIADGVTHYYRVTAVDLNDNESGLSAEVSATPQAAAFMHIAALVLSVDDQGAGNRFGIATVTVLDGNGDPVAEADVTGTFAGDYDGTIIATTDGAGVATLTIGPTNGRTFFSFCVDDIVHAALARDFFDDVRICDAYP